VCEGGGGQYSSNRSQQLVRDIPLPSYLCDVNQPASRYSDSVFCVLLVEDRLRHATLLWCALCRSACLGCFMRLTSPQAQDTFHPFPMLPPDLGTGPPTCALPPCCLLLPPAARSCPPAASFAPHCLPLPPAAPRCPLLPPAAAPPLLDPPPS
jgi:hypothetical protein